ncbi:MAG TPA: hypothetical protein VNB78_06560 [Sphingomicrobium sp.]|jgi:hypothetical protein|nr:hypothetical protein [Sphingomicrobium sp.]
MKTIFKKNKPGAIPGCSGAERRHSDPLQRAFDQVAYAAALEVLG